MFYRNEIKHELLDLPDRMSLSNEQMLYQSKVFYDRMKTRHSVRDFNSDFVSEDIVKNCIRTAGTAPSGANHQPWHFVAISDSKLKQQVRIAAEEEEKKFYEGGGGDEWLKALEPLGTSAAKSHLTVAPWLIVVFAQRWGEFDDGMRYKNYYVPESVGIATGFLISALHHSGLVALTHTPNPMKFLNKLLLRPSSEKPVMIIAVGYADKAAKVPHAAKIKKPLAEILTVF
ncbi:MAG: nitroreductase family protein [Paracoccaceae bacterium]|nr:nitroreductase family protein [Paracoccaceae bacterium]